MTETAKRLATFSTFRILVLGDVMLDHYIWGDATRISPEAPVPVVDIGRETWAPGGAANVALNIATLGGRCSLFGYFGNDSGGTQLRTLIEGHGIKAICAPGIGATITKTRVLVQHQQLCRLDRESPPDAYFASREDILRSLSQEIKRCDAIIFSDYAKGLVTDELIAQVTALGRTEGKFIALDPKPRRRLNFTGLDLITPNKREALQLAELVITPHVSFPAAEVCKRIYGRYAPKHLVITLGEEGMLLSHSGQIDKVIPTTAREVYDVSGAGDTALATLVLSMLSGASLMSAAHIANAAAGVVVGKLGTATVTPKEIIDHIHDTRKNKSRGRSAETY